MNDLLAGAFDLHVHTAPDLVPRCVDDLEMTRRAKAAGMAGFVIKSHHAVTADRAALCTAVVSGVQVTGSITLNHYVGGLNPVAVEGAARSGARVVWFPTTDAANEAGILASWPAGRELPPYLQVKKNMLDRGRLPAPISVADADGRLLPAAQAVLEVISDHDLTLCTGHLGWAEIEVLVPSAAAAGVRKIVITHPESPSIALTAGQEDWLAGQGAYFERCLAYTSGSASLDAIAAAIRRSGVPRNVLSSDLGRLPGPPPDVGLAQFIGEMARRGFSEPELRQLTGSTPRELAT